MRYAFLYILICIQLIDLKLTVDGLEKERDFYFGKLRDIELICQENESENNPGLSKIVGILYATEVRIVFYDLHICMSFARSGPSWSKFLKTLYNRQWYKKQGFY